MLTEQERMERMLWRKQKEIETLVFEHLELVEAALRHFLDAVIAYVKDADTERADELTLETHKAEGQADDVRRRVEAQLLSGALMPASRRDILELVEQVDRLANAAESALDHLLIQQIQVPEIMKPGILEIVEKTDTLFSHVKEAIGSLFRDMDATMEHTAMIEKLEAQIDHIERSLLRKVFAQEDLELARKLQLNNLVRTLVKLSDRGEDLSDHIDLMVAQKHL